MVSYWLVVAECWMNVPEFTALPTTMGFVETLPVPGKSVTPVTSVLSSDVKTDPVGKFSGLKLPCWALDQGTPGSGRGRRCQLVDAAVVAFENIVRAVEDHDVAARGRGKWWPWSATSTFWVVALPLNSRPVALVAPTELGYGPGCTSPPT